VTARDKLAVKKNVLQILRDYLDFAFLEEADEMVSRNAYGD
jgi:hypothetical protein